MNDEALKRYQATAPHSTSGPGEQGTPQTRQGYYFDIYRKMRALGMSEADAARVAKAKAEEWKID